MSCANDAIRASSFIAAPPYFTTTVFPVNSRMYGNASISVSAFRIYPPSLPPRAPSEDVATEVGVLHYPREPLLDIGPGDDHLLPGDLRSREQEIVQQALHHRVEPAGADVPVSYTHLTLPTIYSV